MGLIGSRAGTLERSPAPEGYSFVVQLPGLTIDPAEAGALERLPWRTTSSSGVDWIELASDPDGDDGSVPGTMVVLIRMAPGCGYPEHEHLGPEDVLVLSGGYTDVEATGVAARTVRAGDFVRYPAGSRHVPVALDGDVPCVLYSVAHGGTRVTRRVP